MSTEPWKRCAACGVYITDCSCADPLGGTKYDSGKPPMGLIPRYSLEQVAAVLGHGASKYGKHNWRSGVAVQRNLDAALRHIYAANERENTDPESGLPHLAHAICCLMFALNTIHDQPEFDDRYKAEVG